MGVLSHSVPQRTWKIGFRMTLGARQMDVFGFAFLCLASSAFAGQAVKLTPSTSLTFEVPDKPAYSSSGVVRVELRLHNCAFPGHEQSGFVLDMPVFQVRLTGSGLNGPLWIGDLTDDFGQGNGNDIFFKISPKSDVILRLQRDIPQRRFTVEFWNADGSNYAIKTLPIHRIVPPQLPFQGRLGNPLALASLDYLRWYSKLLPPGASPFQTITGDLADWEFDGDLADRSPARLKLHPEGRVSFDPTPAYPPFVSQGPSRVLRAGHSQKLSAAPSRSLSDSPALTWLWDQVSGPTQLQWSSHSAAEPEITGLVFGSYQLRVTVTDSLGHSAASTVKYGAVETGENDLVLVKDPSIATLLGPMLRLGANPWPYSDRMHRELGDFFGSLQSTKFLDVWNQPGPGTIVVSSNSKTVTGTGTRFLSQFCGGTAGHPARSPNIVIWYPIAGGFGRVPHTVESCAGDTSLTLANPYYATPGSKGGLKYSLMTEDQVGTWINGSSNANYYDNVLAFYSLYYRSGIDDYLTCARTLADRWWEMPWMDRGNAVAYGGTSLFPRLQGMTGLILRALDGRPDMWPGLRKVGQWDYSVWIAKKPNFGVLNDLREDAYATAFVAMLALFDTDPVHRAAWKKNLSSALDLHWATSRRPEGNWVAYSYGNASSAFGGASGTVSVTHGSNFVRGSGTRFQPGWFAETANAFLACDTNGVTNCDKTKYTATYLSPTEFSIEPSYQGSSASGRGWVIGPVVGNGTQPFMLGIAARAFSFALLATGDKRLPEWLAGIGRWMATAGYRPSTRGLWYGRVFPNCEPAADSNLFSTGSGDGHNPDTPEQSRMLAGEVVGGIATAYQLSRDPQLKKFLDDIYPAIFGGDGGPSTDQRYVRDIAAGGWTRQIEHAKDFGFFFGFGGAALWPAAERARLIVSPKE